MSCTKPNAFQGVFGQPKLRDEASEYSNGAFLIMVSAVIEYKFSGIGSDR
jgi:hypothetical protein